MGFFSDLKEDLSQAVSELMVDEEQGAVDVKEEKAENTENAESTEEKELSLAEMLQNIDTIELPEEEQQGEEPAEIDLAEAFVAEASLEQEDKKEAAENEPEAVAEEALAAGQNMNDVDIESMLENVMPTESVEEENRAEESKGAERKMDSYVSRTVSDETAVITEGMTITGDMETEGSVDIIGCVNGNVTALGKLNITGHINGNSKASEIYAEGAKINGEVVSEGAVKIGASSVIIGNISATSAAIAGAVKGDIDVRGPVILDASAIVMGNIKSKSVQINNGAVIEGMCSQCYADVSPTSFFDDYKPDVKKAKQK